MLLLAHLRKLDWVITISSLLLVCIGLISIYSSSIEREDFGNFQKQLVFLAIALTLMFIVSLIDYRVLKSNSYLLLSLYTVGVFALLGLLLFAPTIRGIQGWYRIGGISFDPVEFMKLILILIMAKYFAARHTELYRIRHIFLTGIYFAIPAFLILRQPDLGSALLLVILWIALLVAAGIKMKHFLGILGLGVILFAIGWNYALQGYQKARIISFLRPEFDPLGIGWSQLQSKIAIGNGGFLGQGFGNGSQTQYGFLSEPHTDFIFAALAEEFGFVAIALLFTLLLILLWRILKIGKKGGNNFTRLFAAGIATIFIAHTFVNVGMNLGLLPIVGLPLPLVSYGGSSLILTYIGLGILQSIKSH